MKHNDELQMQPKGNSKVGVSRATAMKRTKSTARMPVLAQWMWHRTPKRLVQDPTLTRGSRVL